MIAVPQELKGRPPSSWKQAYGPGPDAWGPFMVEMPGHREAGAQLRFLEDDTKLSWFDHDHEHLWLLDGPPVVDGATLQLSVDGQAVTIRPLTPEEDTLDQLLALNLA